MLEHTPSGKQESDEERKPDLFITSPPLNIAGERDPSCAPGISRSFFPENPTRRCAP